MPVAAGALILAGSLAGTVGASADSGLPPKTAQELLVALQAPTVESLSGTVVATADLGLPELPAGMTSGGDLTALVSGSHTLRVWLAGPSLSRLALIDQAAEYDVIRNGSDVWTWSSSDQAADHYVLPPRDAETPTDRATGSLDLPSTPQEAAAAALAALDDTTEVSTSGVSEVAGRSVYELILTPRQAGTLVARVVIAIDAETSVPLRVQVFSTSLSEPAYEIGFTSVDFAQPAADIFAFTPPPGATVTEHAAPDGSEPAGRPAEEFPGMDHPDVVGTGWTSVVVGRVPDADAGTAPGADSAGGDLPALLASLPETSGPWGSGRVLAGTLVSAILTDDGRFAIGAVTPEALGAALAQR